MRGPWIAARRGATLWVAIGASGCHSPTRAPPPPPAQHAPQPEAPPTVEPVTPPPPASTAEARVQSLSITVLSTSEAPQGVGEWGFAALVQADDARILFDTGARPTTVLRNAKTLGIDLSTVPTVVLSHHHDDHVGGLLTLRNAVAAEAPEALAVVHGASGLFEPRRYGAKTHEVNDMISIRAPFEATGGRFVLHDRPAEIAPGVWVTGPVPRVHDDERNYSGRRWLPDRSGHVADTLPESQALVIDTDDGWVVLSGCGHAGIVNTATYTRTAIRAAPIVAAVGGFHLYKATPEQLSWTAEQLGAMGLQHFAGAHCTGEAAVRRIGNTDSVQRAQQLGVGERFDLPG